MTSPTQLTLRELRNSGYHTAVVERWNQYARIRQDLFGFVDVLAVGNGHTLGVQCTSYNNVSSRVSKIRDDEDMRTAAIDMIMSGWKVEVWGWRKPRRKWEARRVDMADVLDDYISTDFPVATPHD